MYYSFRMQKQYVQNLRSQECSENGSAAFWIQFKLPENKISWTSINVSTWISPSLLLFLAFFGLNSVLT